MFLETTVTAYDRMRSDKLQIVHNTLSLGDSYMFTLESSVAIPSVKYKNACKNLVTDTEQRHKHMHDSLEKQYAHTVIDTAKTQVPVSDI
jgi:hypothetical protein